MKKQLIVLAIVIAMVLAVMPMAFAAEGDVASVNGQTFASVQTAVEAANGAVVTLLADSDESVAVSGDLYLDLNGKTLAGLTITDGTLYGMDSTTDKYDNADNCGKISQITGNYAADYKNADAKRYLAVKEDSGLSFHRFYVGITNISLAPSVTGFGYKAEFYGDSKVQAQVESIGYNLGLDGYQAITRTTQTFKNVLTLRIKNFDVANFGETAVNAKAVITFKNGPVQESAESSYSLCQVVESVAKSFGPYSMAQKEAVRAMYQRFESTISKWDVSGLFEVGNFEGCYDSAKWNIADGCVTVVGGGGATAQPLQFAGEYGNIDLTINARDYADASTKSRTDVEFVFENGQTVSFGIAEGDRIQTRAGTLLSWKTPYDLNAAEKAQLVIDADEIAAGNEDGLDLRIIRYGTTVYLFIENKQVAICDLTKCANAKGDTESGITADTKMFVYLRHYDDVREAGVQIPYSISTDVKPVEITVQAENGSVSTVSTVNHYVNNVRTSTTSDIHFVNEVFTVTAAPDKGYKFASLSVDGQVVDGTTYSFASEKDSCTVEAVFEEIMIFENNYDSALWDLSGRHDGYVTVIGGGGATAKPLQFVGTYQDVDLTLNARDYADSSTASRTEFGFEFDVDGDGKIDQSVTFGVAEGNKLQTRGGTLLSWKAPYDLNTAEKAQLVIDADELAAGNEDGLDLRIIRYGTTMYLFIENKQVAICDLTKCANSNGDTESGITAETKMYIYLRHYDDLRTDGVQIPFSISTDVKPVEITTQAENGTVSTTSTVNHYVNNGRTSTTSDVHFVGENITLKATAADQEYVHSQTKINGKAVTVNNGTYTFTATEENYQVETVFGKKLFVDNADAKWDLSQQNLGTVTIDGIEKTQGIATLIGGGSKAVAFRDQYTYIDLAITAKENKTEAQKNGGRTDILFEFDTNNDGTMDKNVSFGLVKWDTYCNLETLGNSTNYIPATRKNTLYTLNKAETEAYLADGVELRVIRNGTNVSIMLEGKLVNTFDLTQNNSGVTADMPAKISLRHYDALPEKVVIPFTITGELQQTIFKNNYNADIWDISNQNNGLVVLPNGGGATANPLEFNKTFGNVDVSLVARDYADAANTASRTDLEFIFDNGETVTFGVVNSIDSKTGEDSYRIQTRAGTLLSWKTPYFITEQELIDAYVVTAEEMQSGNPGGLNFRVVRYGTEFYLYLNDVMVKGYDFSYSIAADTAVTVYLRHYDDAGVRVEIPFAITEDVTVEQLRLFAEKEAVTDYAYTFAVIPDTQIVAENDVTKGQTNLAKLYDWIVANKESKNIQFVFGLGDVTDNNNDAEWTLAQTQNEKLLAAGIPYSVVRGNHDLSWYGKDKEAENYTVDDYTNYIGTEAYRAQFGGFYSEDNVANSWTTLEVAGIKYLMITLDWGAKDAILNWASDIIYQHPDHNVIITTHAYLFRDGTTIDDGDLVPPSANGGVNDGDDMWDKLVSKHENIVLVMSGHDPNENIIVNRSTGDNGNTVTAMLIDAQDAEAQEGSMGMVALLHFSADGKTVQVEYYSTAKEKYFMAENQFTTQLDVVQKAQGGTVAATGAYTNVALTEGKSYGKVIADEQKVTLTEMPHTISAWINVPKNITGSAGAILGNYVDNSTANCLNIEITNNGNPRFYFRNAGNYSSSLVFDKVDVRSNTQWVHLALVASGNRVSCYVNGELKQTLVAESTIQLEDTRSELIIGGDLRGGNARYFLGRILELDLYSGILSAEKIQSLYENGKDAVTEGKINVA